MKFFACALALVLAASPAAAHSKYDLEQQLKLLMQWWPGDYDNNEQIVRQSGGGLSKTVSAPFHRLHTAFKRVEMPELGPNVLSVDEWQNNDANDVVRTRLYSLSVDEKEGAIRVRLFTPPGGRADLARLASLKAADLRALPAGCDIFLHWVGGQFEGGVKEKSCLLDRREWFQYQMVLGPKYYWARDRRLKMSDGKVVWEMAPGSDYGWYEQTKARWMICEVLEDPNGDMPKTKKLTEITLHDQGGEADIAWPDGRTLTFLIHSRAFTSPSEHTFPLFRIHEKNNMTVPIAYAYAMDETEHYGLNLGWFYIRCEVTKDPAAK